LDGIEPALRAVDVGCGTGVAGILLAKAGLVRHEVILADINARALQAASINSQAAGVRTTVVHSDVLAGVDGDVDLVLANPPYLNDAAQRAYRHGGGAYGEALGVRIVHEALARLARSPTGGTLLLYTGAPVRDGQDLFFAAVEAELRRAAASYSYHELDPDVFSSELAKPAYQDVERIAAVFLKARVAPGRTH
jgi:methylase of polypeptide subunit release factors